MKAKRLFQALVMGGAVMAITAMGCSGGDNGTDAGSNPDSGGGPDAATPPDASAIPPDAGNIPPDAGTIPPDAGAMCAGNGKKASDGGTCVCTPSPDGWGSCYCNNGCCCWLSSCNTVDPCCM